MKSPKHLDHLLSNWSYDPGSFDARIVKGDDSREVLQMRVDLGILQMETTGRPDGEQPSDHESMLECLVSKSLDDPDAQLTIEQCQEVDREFMQFYHRRICWLHLQFYNRAVMDADHTLRLMDISTKMSPDDEWTESHEQYRPFVLFHRTQAQALAALEEKETEEEGAEDAISAISTGLDELKAFFEKHEAEEYFESDELVRRLIDLRESLRNEYSVGRTLHERLAEAVEQEQYELAAQLRDQLAKREHSH